MKKLILLFTVLCSLESITLFCIPAIRNYGFVQLSSFFCAICAVFLGVRLVFISRKEWIGGESIKAQSNYMIFRIVFQAIGFAIWVALPSCLLLLGYPLFQFFFGASPSVLFPSTNFEFFPVFERWFQLALFGPFASAICGASLGVFMSLVFQKRWIAFLSCIFWIIGSLLISIWQTAMLPLWVVYHPFIGFFPVFASTQERVISAEIFSLPLVRLSQLFWILGISFLFSAGCKSNQLRLSLKTWFSEQKKINQFLLGLIILLIPTWALQNILRPFQDKSGQNLRATLSATRKTQHFMIHYEPNGPWSSEIDWIAFEHEFRYQQLQKKLNIEPDWKTPFWQRWLGLDNPYSQTTPYLVSYLFSSPEQMRQIFGILGETTPSFANPWKRSMYVSDKKRENFFQNHTLIHELAHLFLGKQGDSIFHISWVGFLPNFGLIEGFAQSLDGRAPLDAETIRFAANFDEDESLEHINLVSLFTPTYRITRQSFDSIYSIPSSFCFYLLNHDAPAKLLRVYERGGRPTDFEEVYEHPFAELKTNWIQWIYQQKQKKFLFPPEYFQERYDKEEAQHSLIGKAAQAATEISTFRKNLKNDQMSKAAKKKAVKLNQKNNSALEKKETDPWQKLNDTLLASKNDKTLLSSLYTLEKSLPQQFSFGWFYLIVGKLFFEKGLYQEASYELKQALVAKYSLPFAYQNWARFLLGQSFYFQKQFEQASVQFEALIDLGKDKKDFQEIVDFQERCKQAPLFFKMAK